MKRSIDHTRISGNKKLINKQDLISIYNQYSPELFRYAVRLLNDQGLAEDCISEIFSRFLKVIQKKDDPIENVRAYLFRMTHNWVTDHYRRQPQAPLEIDPDLKDDPERNPSLIAAQEMEKEQVRKALLKLSPDQQQVIHLRFLEDWSYKEIANLMERSVEATRALQYRGFNALRKILLEDEDENQYD